MFALLVWSSASPNEAVAGKLEDFKEAASKRGCEAVPYADERRECKDRSDEKEKYCTEFSCDKRGADKALETLKEKRESLENAKNRKDEQAIPNLERAIRELEDQLKERKYEAQRRITRCEECIRRRESVQDQFKRVKNMVKNETDKELQQYVSTLVDHYEQGEQEHVEPINQVKNALSNCTDVASMSW